MLGHNGRACVAETQHRQRNLQPAGAGEVLAGGWAALVLHALAQRAKRGSELQREIGDAVAKDADRAHAG